MSRTRLTIDPDSPQDVPVGRVDHEVLDATDEEDITVRRGTTTPKRGAT